MVPAPERCSPGLRVVVRRRQPARAGVGGAGGVRRRRRPRHRLPDPRLRQAARQLHLVGEPRGLGRLEHLRGRLPRPRQHRPDRPLAPAARLRPRAVRQHRVDGLLRAEHGGDRRRPAAGRSPRQRPRDEVPGAPGADLRRAPHAGPVERGGRDVLRPPRLAGRLDAERRGALDRRHSAAARRRGHRRARDGAGANRQQAQCRPALTAPGGGCPARRRGSASAGRRQGSAPARGRRCRAPAQPVQEPLRRELVPLALRSPSGVQVSPRPSLRDRVRRAAVDDRLRAGRVDLRDVRRQLELARADLVPDQLSGRQCAPALRAVLRRRVHRRVPDRVGEAATARRGRRRPARPADLALPGRPGRAAPVLRLGRAAPGRPSLEGQHPLQRVLPRRQRRRARGLAPDRLDGDRRRPDRPRPRPRLPDARGAARMALHDRKP